MPDLRSALRVLAFASLSPGAAAAADVTTQETSWRMPEVPGDWTVTLGAGAKMAPAFVGSSASVFDLTPILTVRPTGWSNRSARAARFRSPRDSASISLLNLDGFYAGPAFKFRPARNEGDYEQLLGLGDVDWMIEVGGFAEYWPTDWFRTRVELRRGFNGHQGFIADVSADAVVNVMERWTLSGGPRLTLADTNAIAPYFGIDAAQSLASGLPVFDAKGGVQSVGAGAQVRYQWNPQWASRLYVEYDRLLGDAAASPLVTQRGSPDQVTVGTATTYTFNVKLW